MSKNKLFVELDYNFPVIGISSPLRDYKLCWNINKVLATTMILRGQFSLDSKKNAQKQNFDHYYFNDEDADLVYQLIQNKVEGEIYIPELKNFDYIFTISGSVSDDLLLQIETNLRSVEAVQLIHTVNAQDLKSKERLLFDTYGSNI